MTTLQIEARKTAHELTYTVGKADGGVTGLTGTVAIRDGATVDSWFDFGGGGFKTSGWATRQQALVEVDATNAPGVYRHLFDLVAAGAAPGNIWIAEYEAGTGAPVGSDIIIVVENFYDLASGADVSAAVASIVAQLLATTTAITKGTVLPVVFTGHKGDLIAVPVFRNDVIMTDAELTGATGLSIQFQNLDGAEDITITTGVAVAVGGLVTYTTTAGDLIFETAGEWEYQAGGTTTGGDVFRSQKARTFVTTDLIP